MSPGRGARATAAPRAAKPAGEIVGIQYLRGIAALMVVAFHLAGEAARHGPGLPALTNFGAGVDVFFVISGFVMAYSTGEGRSMTARAFLARRLIRIAPLYWLATGAMLACLLIAPQLMQSAALSWPHVVKSFLFIPAAHPRLGVYFPLLVPGWTINYEMFFYLVFAGAMAAGARSEVRPMAIAIAVLLALFVAGPVLRPGGIAGFLTNQIIGEFLFGIVLALIVRRGAALSPRAAAVTAAIAFVALVAPVWPSEYHILRTGLPAALLVFAGASTPVPVSRPLELLGDSSYSLYLTHAFIASALGQTAAWLGLTNGLAGWTVFVVAGSAGCVVAGLLCWSLLERPMTRRLRRLLADRRGPFVSEAGVPLANPGS